MVVIQSAFLCARSKASVRDLSHSREYIRYFRLFVSHYKLRHRRWRRMCGEICAANHKAAELPAGQLFSVDVQGYPFAECNIPSHTHCYDVCVSARCARIKYFFDLQKLFAGKAEVLPQPEQHRQKLETAFSTAVIYPYIVSFSENYCNNTTLPP